MSGFVSVGKKYGTKDNKSTINKIRLFGGKFPFILTFENLLGLVFRRGNCAYTWRFTFEFGLYP